MMIFEIITLHKVSCSHIYIKNVLLLEYYYYYYEILYYDYYYSTAIKWPRYTKNSNE